MDTMSNKMYTALKSVGTPEENAKEGASVLGELCEAIIKLKSGQRLIQGMVSFNILLSLAIIATMLSL